MLLLQVLFLVSLLVGSVDARRRHRHHHHHHHALPPAPAVVQALPAPWVPPTFVAPVRPVIDIFRHIPVFRPPPPPPPPTAAPVAVSAPAQIFRLQHSFLFGRPRPVTAAPTTTTATPTRRPWFLAGRPAPSATSRPLVVVGRPRPWVQPWYGRPTMPTLFRTTRRSRTIRPTHRPAERCAGVQCPAVVCAANSVPKVSRGACCARCVRTELNACTNRSCARVMCRAGQRYVVSRGGCCGRCVGTPLARCASASCPRLHCRRDQAYTVPAGSCCGYCRTSFRHRCKNTRCPPHACALGQTYTVRSGECCGSCVGKPVRRCRGRACPTTRCNINQLTVVKKGGCCATCVNKTPSRCKYTRCPKTHCRAGQKYRVRRGSCCGSCVGDVLPQCVSTRCPRVSCRRGYTFKVGTANGGCCGRCVRKANSYTLITFNVNSQSVPAATTFVDATLQAAVSARSEILDQTRRLYKNTHRCVTNGRCARRIADAAATVTNSIQTVLTQLETGYKTCAKRDHACRARFAKEARRQRELATLAAREAQLVSQAPAQLVASFQKGLGQLRLCNGARCVHNYAVQARILMTRLRKMRRGCTGRSCRKRLAKAIARANPLVATVVVPSVKQALKVCRDRRACKRHLRRDVQVLNRFVPKVPRSVLRAEKRVNRLVRKAARRAQRCGNRKCAARVARKVRKDAAKALSRAAKRCKNGSCRKIVRADIRVVKKASQRIAKRLPLVAGLAAGKSSRKSTRKGKKSSSSSELARLRARLARYRKSAQACGDEDTACVNNWYSKIAAVSARIAELTRGRKSGKGSKCRRDGKVRSNLMKQITKCADDDARCVRKLFRGVAKVNRRANARRCLRTATRKPAKKAVLLVDPLSLPNPQWQLEFTCVGLKNVFTSWLRRQHLIRAYFLNEAHRCEPADTNCLRAYYQKLVAIHVRVNRNRQHYVRRITRCDLCSAIKVRFNRWLKRQRSRRARLHLQLGLCRPHDTECMQNRLDRLAAISVAITKRRAEVIKLHSDCTWNVTTAKPAVTTQPAVSTRVGAASGLTFSAVLALLVLAFVF